MTYYCSTQRRQLPSVGHTCQRANRRRQWTRFVTSPSVRRKIPTSFLGRLPRWISSGGFRFGPRAECDRSFDPRSSHASWLGTNHTGTDSVFVEPCPLRLVVAPNGWCSVSHPSLLGVRCSSPLSLRVAHHPHERGPSPFVSSGARRTSVRSRKPRAWTDPLAILVQPSIIRKLIVATTV